VIYKTRRRYRGEPICADPTADPKENETALHFSAGDRYLWISSYEPAVIAGLLGHPDFRIGHIIFMKANRGECVVGVVGKLPIGALSIGRRRDSDSHEFIVARKKCSDTRRRRAQSVPKKRPRKKQKPLKKSAKR